MFNKNKKPLKKINKKLKSNIKTILKVFNKEEKILITALKKLK